ncbi:MAG: SgcJ/EcaC family oxidoreductase [Bacteroidetes bacterium]|jgi:uncharacterized protein (TIGR02246 family)|nr:SgcJ/EcaC family oxidoreductase [Bacteroidota bacterium]
MEHGSLDRPERIPEVFVEAWNERDAHRLASVFDEDAEFVNVTGLWWHDREAIERAHAYGLAHIFDRSTLELVQTRVKRLTDNVAVVHARMRLTGQTSVADVDRPRPRTTHFSFVAHRTGGGWSCASAQNTDVIPGTETNVIDERGRLRAVTYRT